MKIKTTKQMRLDELIKYVWNDENPEAKVEQTYYSRVGKRVSVDSGGIDFYEVDNNIVLKDDLFTVSTEEEITEETKFEELWEVYYNKVRSDVDTYKNGEANGVYSTSISQIMQENSIDGENITLAIYYGSTLIWSKNIGIPAEGVIEV